MSEQTLVLPMTEARLRLEMTHPSWWEWTLIAEGVMVTLGADVLENIGDRVIERLSKGGEQAGEIDGRQVCWLLSLAEKHHSVYCAVDGVDRLLYFQDAGGHIVWRDRLSVDHVARWTSVLDATLTTSRQRP